LQQTRGNETRLSVVSLAASSNKTKGSRQDDSDEGATAGGDGSTGALIGIGQNYGQALATNILDVVSSSLTGNIGGIISGSLRIFRNPQTQTRVQGGLDTVAGSIVSSLGLVGITTPNPNKLNETSIQTQGGGHIMNIPGDYTGNIGNEVPVSNQFVGSSGPGGPDFINPGNAGNIGFGGLSPVVAGSPAVNSPVIAQNNGGSPGTTIVNARPGQQVFVVVDHSQPNNQPLVSQVSPAQINSQGFVPINPQTLPVAVPQINLNVLPAQNYAPQQQQQQQSLPIGSSQQQTQQQSQESAFPERPLTSGGRVDNKEDEDEDEDEDTDDL